ncbi:venom carboxylesterase-6-like [Daphnia carinata]|uniref:venom carboxylesterase-6-like n=1 Tax=Daphnia carinata TaxID=120202 RepID=UPI00257AF137|nr:venom carboxylesterase-6-like [Daphnia carinata]
MQLAYVFAFVLLSFVSSDLVEPIVNVPTLGRLRGSRLSSASGRTIEAFRAIPYAQPPVGDLRFKDPLPAKDWQGSILDATREAPKCVQFNSIVQGGVVLGQEDCLYLNVYVPQLNGINDPLPVMVWIHGGAFYMGSGNGVTDMFGPNYLLDRDVVLVTLNYRLGPLGFLSTEDAEAPGNYGLLDQSLALRWVRNYIAHFGGNADLITIFGESAGGASVNFHVLSPYSKGLFHRAIIQSGTSTCPWALNPKIGEYTKFLANHLNCSSDSSRELLTCLRTRKAEDIAGIRKHFTIGLGFGMFPLAFVPRIDVERNLPFLPAYPEELVAERKFNQVPLILGVTKNEGALVSASYYVNGDKHMDEFKADPIGTIRYMIQMENEPRGLEMAHMVHDHLFTLQKPYEDQKQQVEMIASDYGLFKCTDDSVTLFSRFNSQPTYYYFYTHRGQFSFPQIVGVPPEIDLGVCHADELFLLFTPGYFPRLSVPADLKVSATLIDLWTSFAKNGAPESSHVDVWLPVEQGVIRYLDINERSTFVNDKMPFEPRLAFWNKVKAANRIVTKDEL